MIPLSFVPSPAQILARANLSAGAVHRTRDGSGRELAIVSLRGNAERHDWGAQGGRCGMPPQVSGAAPRAIASAFRRACGGGSQYRGSCSHVEAYPGSPLVSRHHAACEGGSDCSGAARSGPDPTCGANSTARASASETRTSLCETRVLPRQWSRDGREPRSGARCHGRRTRPATEAASPRAFRTWASVGFFRNTAVCTTALEK